MIRIDERSLNFFVQIQWIRLVSVGRGDHAEQYSNGSPARSIRRRRKFSKYVFDVPKDNRIESHHRSTFAFEVQPEECRYRSVCQQLSSHSQLNPDEIIKKSSSNKLTTDDVQVGHISPNLRAEVKSIDLVASFITIERYSATSSANKQRTTRANAIAAATTTTAAAATTATTTRALPAANIDFDANERQLWASRWEKDGGVGESLSRSHKASDRVFHL